MTMTVEDFRKLALSLPEVIESSHMDHPDFRVHGKIFATIWPAEKWGMVKLTPEQQSAFVRSDPEVFVAVRGGWGLRGATNVILDSAEEVPVRAALHAAWANIEPPKRKPKSKD
jgi:hypothetical protein